jgi:hypothetical protein
MMAIIICNTSFSQDTKKVNEKIIELEKRILVLENKIDEISKQPLLVNSSLTKTFNIKYEIAYWDKDGQPRGAWARSGWKLAFSTTDINQNIQIQGKPFAKDTKKLTVKIYVNDKLIKSESKELKFTSIEGPYCQVILSEL